MRYLVIILIALAFLGGCASQQSKPEFSDHYNEDRYLVAQAESDKSIEHAETQALERLARFFDTQVQFHSKSQETLSIEEQTDYQLDMDHHADIRSEMDFRGLQIERREHQGTYHVLAAVDKQAFAHELGFEIRQLDAQIDELAQSDDLHSLAAAWELQIQREELSRMHRVIAHAPIETEHASAILQARIEKKLNETYDIDLGLSSDQAKEYAYQEYARDHARGVYQEYQRFHGQKGDIERFQKGAQDADRFARKLDRALNR